MKGLIFGLIVWCGVVASAAVTATTNYVGTVATRQQVLAMCLPAVDVSWETNIVQDTEGDASVSYVGPHCDQVIADWLANSTTNRFCTYTNGLFGVKGNWRKFDLTYDGRWTLGGLEDWQDASDSGYYRPRISIEEREVTPDRIRVKWRYYRWNNTNGQYKYRECFLTMTVTPVWRCGGAP